MTVAERQRQLAEEISLIEDRHERLSAIVDRARCIPSLPVTERTAANRVKGCHSPVWVLGDLADGRLNLRFDAESPVVKGLVALLCELYDRATPADIVASEPTLLDDLGLIRDLSPTRRHGLAAVRHRIRELATQLGPLNSERTENPWIAPP